MSLGRPAMRGREARKIQEALATHKFLMDRYINLDGMSREEASKNAFEDMKLMKMVNTRVRKPRRNH